jgi:1-acyl-sn-glycerol-3-phosphate acyltransferase
MNKGGTRIKNITIDHSPIAVIFRRLHFYLCALLGGLWFVISTLIGLGMMLVRWKNPSVGAIMGRIFGWGTCKLLGYRLRLENAEALYVPQPCIYVANHQSNLDLITFGWMAPKRTVVIGKKELKWIPLFGWLFAGTGMLMIDRKDRTQTMSDLKMTTEAMQQKGYSIWFFAEGSRNYGQGLLPLKKGAFHMAVAAQVPIVPIVSQFLGSYVQLKEQRIIPGDVCLRVLAPIATTGMTAKDVPQLMATTRAAMVDALCAPEMKYPPNIVAQMRASLGPNSAA